MLFGEARRRDVQWFFPFPANGQGAAAGPLTRTGRG
ncbi:hypothetical protein AvCA_11060 [Azotobacter vinelandii CA]|uniref:Uncharacterized protein n=2 Tax=Azotobacter vinelandii TaxID=354 RepID=C1DPA5_AZOVD|nr:hypothetical protein Avin_11060 [Azotobacter vinelandii DJ]AGK15411.1 hypothetical protein AvCA_11060 [Azotobacter vinelandii CA]AGK19730.1 hypothetical protein AvCA6_11060 [Azotobacter vinelandii CA6]